LQGLGEVYLRRSENDDAARSFRDALTLAWQAGYQHGEVRTLRSLAQALHAAGRSAEARSWLEQALLAAAESGNTYQEAGTHEELAQLLQAVEGDQARQHWELALDLYTRLGAPEAGLVRARLAGADSPART